MRRPQDGNNDGKRSHKGVSKKNGSLNYPTTDLSTRNDSKKMPEGMSLDALLFKPRNIPKSSSSSGKLSKFQVAKNQQHEAEEYLKRVDDVEIDDPVIKEAVDLAMGIVTRQNDKFHISQVSFVYDLGFKSIGSSDGQEALVYVGSLDSPTIIIGKPILKSEKDIKKEKMDQNERDLIQEMIDEMSKAATISAIHNQKHPKITIAPFDDDSGSDIFETDGIDYVPEIKEKPKHNTTADKVSKLNLFKDEKLEDLKVELPFNFEGGQNLEKLIQNSHKINVNRDANVDDDDMEMEVLENIDDDDGVNYDYDNFYDSDSDGDVKKSKNLNPGKSGGEPSRLNQEFQKLDNHFAKKYGSGLKEDGKPSDPVATKRKAKGGSNKPKRTK